MDIDARQPDREPRDYPLRRTLGRSARDQADVGGGSSHVEGDRVAKPDQLGDPTGAHDTACRSGEKRPGGVRRSLAQACDASGRTEHERLGKPAWDTALAEPA